MDSKKLIITDYH